MRVVLYARVSKDDKFQDGRYQEPENQLVPLRSYCATQNWTIIKEYVDHRSGADASRPQFRDMMKYAQMRLFDVILVWKLDRFSREPMFVVMGYINKLRESKVGLISMTETWLDTRESNPVSELILGIMAWFSGEERRKISERVKIGIAQKRREGTYTGGRRGKDRRQRKPRKDILQKRGVYKTPTSFIKSGYFGQEIKTRVFSEVNENDSNNPPGA